jgi:hypothetical protein
MVFPVSALFPTAPAFLPTTRRSIAETIVADKEHFAGDSHAFWKKPCKESAGNRLYWLLRMSVRKIGSLKASI